MSKITTDVIMIFAGFAAEVIAFTCNEFYLAKGRFGVSNKRAPKWAGKLMFGLIGAVFIIIGFLHLLRD